MMSGFLRRVLVIFMGCLLYAGAADARRDMPPQNLQISPLPLLCEAIGEVSVTGCKNNPKIRKLGCDDISPPPEYWGGLKPYLAMGVCRKFKRSSGEPSVRMVGCMAPLAEQYITLVQSGKADEPRLIRDKEEFRAFFTPIEDQKEALSYISALTGSYPKYQFPENNFIWQPVEKGGYTTKKLVPTAVEEKKEGFLVRLFDHPRCGCHVPELFEIEYFVGKDGRMEIKNKRVIWRADKDYTICVD